MILPIHWWWSFCPWKKSSRPLSPSRTTGPSHPSDGRPLLLALSSVAAAGIGRQAKPGPGNAGIDGSSSLASWRAGRDPLPLWRRCTEDGYGPARPGGSGGGVLRRRGLIAGSSGGGWSLAWAPRPKMGSVEPRWARAGQVLQRAGFLVVEETTWQGLGTAALWPAYLQQGVRSFTGPFGHGRVLVRGWRGRM
jgi:hypothetical protein